MFQKTSSYFTKQIFCIGNIPICSYTINKITFIITNITTIIIIIIIIIIFKFNITIITIMIKSTIVTIILSFVLHFFDIRIRHHSNLSVFFLLLVFYYLLALDVIFCCRIFLLTFCCYQLYLFWKILVLSINDFQNLSCAITLTVDWC